MKNEKNILEDLKLVVKPVVPQGFFDHFYSDLMLRIDNESGFLGQLKKTKKPDLPADYFSTFTPPTHSPFSIEKMKKKEQPDVPADYFENFSTNLMGTISDEKGIRKKKGRIIPMRILIGIGTIAAAFLIFFSVVNYNKNQDQIIGTEITAENDELEDEVYDTYLAYMGEDEIIDLLIENEIDLEESTPEMDEEDYFDYSTEDIEDFYLDI